jgi:transcription antitermination factor NusG
VALDKDTQGGEMSETVDDKQWYAIALRPRFEKTVASHLQHKGYEEFLPLYRSRRRWSDRIKEVELPLFPGYIFCKFDIMQRLPILIIPGVLSIVGVGPVPLAVAEHEISGIQKIVNSGLAYGPWPSLYSGQRVRIQYGPLRGLEGIVLEARDKCQLIVSVTMLSRAVSVTIDRDSLVPVAETSRRPSVNPRIRTDLATLQTLN